MPASDSRTAIYAAIAANIAIAIVKFTAAILTGSSAMLAEAIHTTVDTCNGSLILVGQHLAKRPPDDDHPFGHGKELYVWSLIVAVLVFAIGGGMSIFEGVIHILSPEPVSSYAWNYAVLGAALLFDGASWVVSFRTIRSHGRGQSIPATIRRSKDPAIFVVFLEDSADIAGILVAASGLLLVQFTSIHVFDGIASLIIGLIVAGVAVVLTREARGLLVGEAADQQVVRNIRRIASDDPAVAQANRPLTMQLGPDRILVNLDIRFRDGLSADELATAVGRLERNIRDLHPQATRIFIEAAAMTDRTDGEDHRP